MEWVTLNFLFAYYTQKCGYNLKANNLIVLKQFNEREYEQRQIITFGENWRPMS